MMMIAVGSYILIYFVGIFGVEAIAGYTSAGRYEQLFFLPLLGLSTATVSIVGQNYGAKQYQRVFETYKKGIKIGVIASTPNIPTKYIKIYDPTAIIIMPIDAGIPCDKIFPIILKLGITVT